MPQATYSLVEAAELLGIGKSSAYQAVKKGTFPVAVIHVGARCLVPKAPLHEMLGITEEPAA